jgi:hypothetical protein
MPSLTTWIVRASMRSSSVPISLRRSEVHAKRSAGILFGHCWLAAVQYGTRRARKGWTVAPPQGTITGPFFWALVLDPVLTAIRKRMGRNSLGNDGYPISYTSKAGGATSELPYHGVIAYADDIAVWATGFDVTGLVKVVNGGLKELAEFSTREAIALSAKSQCTLFCRRSPPGDELASITTCKIQCGSHSWPLDLLSPQRFLGVWFDPGLDYVHHVDKAVSAAEASLTRLRSIRHLLSPATCLVLVSGVVLPHLSFGSTVVAPQLSVAQVARLDRVISAAARLVTQAIASAPTEAILREADLLPMTVIARMTGCLHAAKIRRRPVACPLRHRFVTTLKDVRQGTQVRGHVAGPMDIALSLRQWVPPTKLLAGSTRLQPSALPLVAPEDLVSFGRVHFLLEPGTPGVSKTHPLTAQLAANLAQVANLPHDVVLVMSDGSVVPGCDAKGEQSAQPARTGAGFMVFNDLLSDEPSFSAASPTGPWCCSYTAELEGVRRVLEWAKLHPDVRPLGLLTDSLSSISALASGPLSRTDTVALQLWRSFWISPRRVRCTWGSSSATVVGPDTTRWTNWLEGRLVSRRRRLSGTETKHARSGCG